MTTTAAGPSIDLLQDINAAFNARDVDRKIVEQKNRL